MNCEEDRMKGCGCGCGCRGPSWAVVLLPPLELEDRNWSSRVLERTVPSDIRQIIAFCTVTEDTAAEDCADA